MAIVTCTALHDEDQTPIEGAPAEFTEVREQLVGFEIQLVDDENGEPIVVPLPRGRCLRGVVCSESDTPLDGVRSEGHVVFETEDHAAAELGVATVRWSTESNAG